MKDISYNSTFIPHGAPATTENTYNGDSLFFCLIASDWLFNVHQSAVTFGAGVQWHEAYDSANQQGRFIVGGLSAGASIGAAGGWVTGGGHSAFSPKFGFDIVIPIYSACA